MRGARVRIADAQGTIGRPRASDEAPVVWRPISLLRALAPKTVYGPEATQTMLLVAQVSPRRASTGSGIG